MWQLCQAVLTDPAGLVAPPQTLYTWRPLKSHAHGSFAVKSTGFSRGLETQVQALASSVDCQKLPTAAS
jgi:hypothetical protein